MVSRYTGGFLSSTEQVTDSNSANGVFTLSDHQEKTALGNFPTGRWTPSRSLRFTRADSTYLYRNAVTPTDGTKATMSFWIKKLDNTTDTNDSYRSIFYCGTPNSDGLRVAFARYGGYDNHEFQIAQDLGSSSSYFGLRTTQVFRDTTAWYHFVIRYDSTETIDAGRVRIFVNGNEITSFISRTNAPLNHIPRWQINGTQLKIGRGRDDVNEFIDMYLTEFNFIDGQALMPTSFGQTDAETGTWVPIRYTGTYGNNGYYLPFSNNDTTTALGLDMSPSKNMLTYSEQFDNAAWTKGDLNVTANAVNNPLTGTATAEKLIPNTTTNYHTIYQGATVTSSTYYTMSVYAKASGYTGFQMTESNTTNAQGFFNLSTGTCSVSSNNQSLYDATAIMEDVGNGWYRCSVTFKTGSVQTAMNQFFYLWNSSGSNYFAGNGTDGVFFYGAQLNAGKFANTYVTTAASAIVNNFTTSGFSVTAGITNDSFVDVPGIASPVAIPDTGGIVRGNYCTLNPLTNYLAQTYYQAGTSVRNGNLDFYDLNNAGNNNYCFGTMSADNGKYYWEVRGNSGSQYVHAGIIFRTDQTLYVGTPGGNGVFYANGTIYHTINGSQTNIQTGLSGFSNGDILGIAVDSINKTLQFYRNGVALGNIIHYVSMDVSNQNIVFPGALSGNQVGMECSFNFGQRPWSFTPPAGYRSLCTTNLPNPTIKRSKDHFDVRTWIGNGSAITVGDTPKETSAYQIARSLRLRSSNNGFLSRTPSVTGNRRTWTWSAWVKVTKSNFDGYLFQGLTDGNNRTPFALNGGYLQFRYISGGSTSSELQTRRLFRAQTWRHIVLAVDTTLTNTVERVKLYVDGVRETNFTTATYPSQNTDTHMNLVNAVHTIGAYASNDSNLDCYFAETNFIDGQQLTPDAFGQFDALNNWFPRRYTGTYGTNGFYLPFSQNTGTSQNLVLYSEQFNDATWPKADASITANSTTAPNGTTTADTLTCTVASNPNIYQNLSSYTANVPYTASVWIRGNNTTAAAIQLYVNGGGIVTHTSASVISGPGTVAGVGTGIITITGLSTTEWSRISVTGTPGSFGAGTALAFYIKTKQTSITVGDSIYIWGAQVEQSSTAGYYYPTVASTQSSVNNLGADLSIATGGYNSFVPNNVSVTAGVTYDSMLDSPTEYDDGSGNLRGDYCVINPFTMATSSPIFTISNGGLTYSCSSSPGNAGRMMTRGTLALGAGKTYWEIQVTSTTNAFPGICDAPALPDASTGSQKYIGISSGGGSVANTTGTYSGTTFTFTTNDYIGFAFDGTAMTLALYKNGNLIGTYSGIERNVTWFPMLGINSSSAATGMEANFGQRPFQNTPPAGFKAHNTKNLRDAGSFNLPDSFGNVVNTPDLVWIKNRGNGSPNHSLFDTLRGPRARLNSNTNNASSIETDGMDTFLPNGINITGSDTPYNAGGQSYVSWMWNRGKTPGFDIVTYGGNSDNNRMIAHNLGQVPAMYVTKCLTSYNSSNGFNDWALWHKDCPTYTSNSRQGKQSLWLHLVNAASNGVGGFFNNPTSTHFGPNQTSYDNVTGQSYIAYLWAEIPGFSKFGEYTGNGSADGPYVYCGFRPAFVMTKLYSGSGNWYISDNRRSTVLNGNGDTLFLYSESAASESDYNQNGIDFLSNGFKIRNADNSDNATNGRLIYAAFAESPFKYANAR